MVNWLRRFLILPRLNLSNGIAVFLLVATGVPLVGAFMEWALEKAVGETWKGAAFLGWFTVVSLLSLLTFRRTGLFEQTQRRQSKNPEKVRCLVMLASPQVPTDAEAEELCKIQDRAILWEKFERLGWLELVVRAVGWHLPVLQELVLLNSSDGLKPEEEQRVLRLLGHFLNCHAVVLEKIRFVSTQGSGNDLHATHATVEDLQHRWVGDHKEIIFDFTGGTKVMSAAVVLACLDDRFDLQYFLQVPRKRGVMPDDPAYAHALGVLDIERQAGRTAPRLVPLQITTDAERVFENVRDA